MERHWVRKGPLLLPEEVDLLRKGQVRPCARVMEYVNPERMSMVVAGRIEINAALSED